MDDAAIDRVVRRLARPAPSGRLVVERAAVLAEGAHCSDIEEWILRNGGEAEASAPPDAGSGGVYGDRKSAYARIGSGHPARYFLPSDALPAQPVQSERPVAAPAPPV